VTSVPRVGYGELIRRRSFGVFLTAGALQFAAPTGVLVVLLYVVVLSYPAAERTTFGALALAFLGLSSAVPTLVTMVFSGALADRSDRGVLMRATNLLALLATAGLAVDLVFSPATRVSLPGPRGFYVPVWVLLTYPTWAVLATTSTLFRPAYNTIIPRLVETSALGRANAVIYAAAAVVSAGGTLAVGTLLTVASPVYALAVPFLLLFATQVALVLVRVDLSVERKQAPRSIWSEARDGFAYLVRRRELLEITLASLVINFLAAVALVELGLYVSSWLGLVQGIWYGAMVASATAGAACGLVLIARFDFEHRAGRVMMALTLIMGFALIALVLVRSVWFALPIIFAYGMVPGMIATVFLSTVQATVPDEIMGRVFAADELGSYALVPVGQTAGGALTVAVGVQGTYLIAGGGITALGVLMLGTFGALRRLGYQAHRPPAAPAASGG
jgi:MFS family permease